MRVLGIDPGMSGAVAAYDTDTRTFQVLRDFKHLRDVAFAVSELAPEGSRAVLELVSARPEQGVSSMFTFGRATGVALGALYLTRTAFIETTPTRWQGWAAKRAGWRAPFDSRGVFIALRPDCAATVARKKDHNSADALLMALWGADMVASGTWVTSRDRHFEKIA